MNETVDLRVAAFGREVEALCARTGNAGARHDVDATVRLLHDFASTFSLLEDLATLPESENLPPSTVGRWAAEMMVLAEGVSAAIGRERAAARRAASRSASDNRVVMSLLGLSVLFNLLLLAVALR